MKRVLVTGATGFIGRHALAALAVRGFEVHGVSRGRRQTENQAVAWHDADLLDPARVAALVRHVQPTHLLHLAWYAVPGLFWQAPENDDWVSATAGIVDAARDAGVQRIVAAGSCAEYDWSDGVCDEDRTPVRPSTPYGRAKAAASAALLARAGEFRGGCAWGRVFFLYGPHEHPSRLVASIVRAVLSGRPAGISEGHQRRDFLYVEDVGEAFAALVDASLTGVVNVSSGQPVSVRDLATRAVAAAGRPDLLRPGAVPTRESEPPLLVGVTGKLWTVAGWRPRVSLDEGLARAVAYWRESFRAVP